MPDTSNTLWRLPDRPPKVRPLLNEQSERLAAQFPDLPSVANCVTCRGAKSFRWYALGEPRTPESVVSYQCNCEDQFVMHRRFLHAGIHENYQRLCWEDFTYLPESARAAVDEYLSNADPFISAGFGMVIRGEKGNGKTLMANLMMKDLVYQGVDCYAATFAAMLDMFAGGWHDKDDKLWFNQRVRNAGVLLIDDLGRERNKGAGSLGENALEEVVRHRVTRSKPTFLTTNKTMDEIEGGYGQHLMSLLSERSTVYDFHGADRRPEMNVRFRSEILAGLTRPVMWW